MKRRRLLLGCAIGLIVAAGLPVHATASETRTYTYDALGRLVAVQSAGTINDGDANSLCYDPAGNRTLYKSSSSGAIAACDAQLLMSQAEPPEESGTSETPPEAEAVADEIDEAQETAGEQEAPGADPPPDEPTVADPVPNE